MVKNGEKKFIDLFADVEVFEIQNIANNINYPAVLIPQKYVRDFLITTVYDNYFNLGNGNRCEYYALGKVNLDGYWLLLYNLKKGDESKTYISVFSIENLLEKNIMIKDMIGDSCLTDFKINYYEGSNYAELEIKDKHTPAGSEPGASFTVDYYWLDRSISYKETHTHTGDRVYIDQWGYSVYSPSIKPKTPGLSDYFTTFSTIPDFRAASEKIKVIPDQYLKDIFWFDPVRGHRFDYYASCKIKIKEGWLLYIIRSNKIEADAYISIVHNNGRLSIPIHIFNGQFIDGEPWSLDYTTKETKNHLVVKTFLYLYKGKPDKIKLSEFQYKIKLP